MYAYDMFMRVFVSWSMCGGQRTTFGPWLSSSTFVSFLRIEFSLSLASPLLSEPLHELSMFRVFFNTYFVYALHAGYVR